MSEVANSPKYETVKDYYDKKAWELNQVHDAVGRWITAEEYKEITGEEYVAPEKVPTDAELMMAATQETQLIMMEAMADQYEEGLERDLNNMEVQATIYEAILELGGNV